VAKQLPRHLKRPAFGREQHYVPAMSGSSPALTRRAIVSGAAMLAVMAVLLFGLAGTLAWWQGWLFLLIYGAWAAGVFAWLYRHDKALFERRLRGGPTAEKHRTQRVIMAIASAGFLGLLAVPALDQRLGWSHTSAALALAGNLLFSLGWAGIVLVFRENSYSASTVEVMPNQTVVSTGPYAIVRHPMYAAAVFLLAGIPLALGSWWGLVPLVLTVPVLIWRLLDEERLLTRDLPGYAAYRQQVPYRLIPSVW